jgi:hypothetical protein
VIEIVDVTGKTFTLKPQQLVSAREVPSRNVMSWHDTSGRTVALWVETEEGYRVNTAHVVRWREVG